MKNNFVELAISTRDGKFMARYSEKGLAGLDFPQVRFGAPRRPDVTAKPMSPPKSSAGIARPKPR